MKPRLLTKDDIQVKVKQINGNGCLLLLYKDARVDMSILDETYGSDNWACEYKTVGDVLYCGIGVWSEKANQFIWKWDCGIESRADGEGNEKKGEASDAFKRAGFKWGIGRELYTAPFIWAKVPTVKDENGKWQLKDRYQKFNVEHIAYDEQDNIKELVIKDNNGLTVYRGHKE